MRIGLVYSQLEVVVRDIVTPEPPVWLDAAGTFAAMAG